MFKILCIAPYFGMRETLLSCARQYPQISLDVIVADLDESLNVLNKDDISSKYDVIISRGGTAELLESEISMPLVRVPVSGSDVLRALEQVRRYNTSFAFMGFPAITDIVYLISDITGQPFSICTLTHGQDIGAAVKNLRDSGTELIIGDTVTCRHAQETGIEHILLDSGVESIHQALRQAIDLCRAISKTRLESDILHRALDVQNTGIAVFCEGGEILYQNFPISESSVLDMKIRRCLADLKNRPNARTYFQYDGRCFLLCGSRFRIDGSEYYSLQLQDVVSAPHNTSWYTLLDGFENGIKWQTFSLTLNHSPSVISFLSSMYQASSGKTPVIITGEKGTELRSAAYLLYREKFAQDGQFIYIDCNLMHDSDWKYFLGSHNSFLYSVGETLCFAPMESSLDHMEQLCEYIRDSCAAARNRLIFLFESEPEAHPLFRFLSLLTPVPALVLPPLRERKGDLPMICAGIINKINVEYGTSLIGLTQDAEKAVGLYDWPGNFVQLYSSLQQMALIETEKSYIQLETAKAVLDSVENSAVSERVVDLSGTLDQICARICRKVLDEEGGNRSRAASRLGISRSTLWKRLKTSQEDKP